METTTSQHLFFQNQLIGKFEFDRSYCTGTSVNASSPTRTLSKVFLIGALFFTLLVLESTGARNLTFAQAPNIFINEFMVSNDTNLQDEDYNEYSDWIELYNAGEQSVDLEGFYLTDDLNDPTKWQIPAGAIIEEKGFMLFWADGKDTETNNTAYHTNFQLSKTGEEIALFDAQGALVDSISYAPQETDVSFGRQPDGVSDWYFFAVPTPRASNVSEGTKVTPSPQFSLEAGFYTENQQLALSVDSPSAQIHYTLDGSEPTEASPVYTGAIPIASRVGDANVFSEIRTTKDPYSWLPDWNPPVGEVFKSTAVRARAYKDGELPSRIITKTYFVDENILARYPTLAVLSLVSDYEHLFDDATGIYVPGNTHVDGDSATGNYYQDWEKPAHLEFFESDGTLGFSEDIGIRIQGGTSPSSPQKGLHVLARDEYGSNRIRYPLFETAQSKANDLTEFKRFIIRAWGTSRMWQLITDSFAQTIMAETDLDISDYRPAVVFINGEYWGLHELRESHKNSWYYQSHYGIDRENPGYDILQHLMSTTTGRPTAFVDEGDAVHWNAMINYMDTHDMSLPEHYNYIRTQMDVDNFIMYVGHSVYSGKWDWPNWNEASWRPRTPDGKWKWIQYDMETGFAMDLPELEYLGDHRYGPGFNMVRQVLYGGTHILPGAVPPSVRFHPQPVLNALLVNTTFKNAFINWFADYMNTYLSTDLLVARVNEMVAELAPYMGEYQDRWQVNYDWDDAVQVIRDYVTARPGYLREQIVQEFGLGGTATLTLNTANSAKGVIKINALTIDEDTPGVSGSIYPWQGVYFKGIPIQIQAVPKPGYQLKRWQGISGGAADTIEITLSSNATLTAVFEESGSHDIVINEIHYNPSPSQGNDDEYEFIELYNATAAAIDVSGYTFSDGIQFTFPQGSTIAADEYIVVTSNPSTYNGEGYPVFAWESGNLANDGELIQLEDADGNLIDRVDYDDEAPWPTEPDGDGPTLSLIDPALDNALAENWRASNAAGGTPGRINFEVRLNVSALTTNATGPPDAGQSITLTLEANGQESILYYKYLVRSGYQTQNPGPWQMVQDWSTNNTLVWTPTTEGHYILIAYVSDDTSGSSFHQAGITIETGGNSANPIQITDLTTNMGYPQASGISMNLDTTATGGSGPLYYRYYYRKGTTGQWIEIKGYSIDSSSTWTPTEDGLYVVVVHVTDDPSGNSFSIAGMTCAIGE